MEELLTKLYERISDAFQENLKQKELFFLKDETSLDVFKTLISLNKTKKDLNELMLKGSISIDELKYLNKEALNECFDSNYVIKGNSINSDKVFIGINGVFELYSMKNWNIRDGLIAYDSNKFIEEKKLTLKSQEKIWCIFLILFGADNKERSFNTEALSETKLIDYHTFLISIEKEMENFDICLGKKIGWETGKDSVFRKFITNNVDLPKTSLYFKKGQYQYYLDLSKRKNTTFLLDLILDKYEGERRLMVNDIFYDALMELSSSMPITLGVMNEDINKYLIEELKG
ncbi:hypothetical protein LNI94_01675 [Tenacibaculum finnmarkense genomovar ulcerans]|uniref:hypothetical protein n=1 Tax=Tenacibaculum finnmarkense TaxID=2781243 RepID=UPI001E3F98F7|nr:hypothetical protein [Tenacibaculum finnmarkense]MCD8421600.1 hypothetical protein [Tenacibaculum finnmarkense genomovar ulcerans]MCG8784824.1 hypothetical protein [Tenacibaculum finnmarkense]